MIPDFDAAGIAFVYEFSLVSPAGVRSTWISQHGPHGPVSPIIQKLSFLFPKTMCFFGSSPSALKISAQIFVGFLVKLGWLALTGFINGGVEAFRRKFPDLGQIPTPFQ